MSDRDPPRPEPEIIPPGTTEPSHWRGQRGTGRDARVWVWSSGPHGAQMRYGRPGPLGLLAVFTMLAALGAVGFFVFLGLAAITLPVIAALAFAGILVGVLRRL